jgi:hypothetical protein
MQLTVLVLRTERPRTGFTWQLRIDRRAIPPLLNSDRVYASEADARLAGEHALEQWKSKDHPS